MSSEFGLTKLALGLMRLNEWEYSPAQLLHYLKAAQDLCVNTIDVADIYGNYSVEEQLGKALALDPDFRKYIRIVGKVGIKLVSNRYPKRRIKHYDTSYGHIMETVEQSLMKMQIDYLDILLIHRPDPFMNAGETARALNQLVREGKVLQIGVSNFAPPEIELLQSYLEFPLRYNQVELSLLKHDALFNGDLSYLQMHRIRPMAWSPLAGGDLLNKEKVSAGFLKLVRQLTREHRLADPMQVLLAWLWHHPARILPVLGTGKIERLKLAADARDVMLPRESIYELLELIRKKPVA